MKALFYVLPLLAACLASEATVHSSGEDQRSDEQSRVSEVIVVDELPEAGWGYDITNARLIGDELRVDVRFAGGCSDHTFELYWDGQPPNTNPPELNMMLVHGGEGDMCEALLGEELIFRVPELPPGSRILLDGSDAGIVAIEAEKGASEVIMVDSLPDDEDDYSLDGLTLQNDQLVVAVSYWGGCEQHEFNLYWDGLIREVGMGRAPMILTHNEGNEYCSSPQEERLNFVLPEGLLPGMDVIVSGPEGDILYVTLD